MDNFSTEAIVDWVGCHGSPFDGVLARVVRTKNSLEHARLLCQLRSILHNPNQASRRLNFETLNLQIGLDKGVKPR